MFIPGVVPGCGEGEWNEYFNLILKKINFYFLKKLIFILKKN